MTEIRDNQNLIEWGTRIRWARLHVEPNLAKFARLIGVPRSLLAEIEAGISLAMPDEMEHICHSLRIDAAYVFQGQLSGVDPELAQLLARYHPELRVH